MIVVWASFIQNQKESKMPGLTTLIIIAVVVIFLIIIGCMGYVSAKSNECVVITGLGKERYLIGKTGFMLSLIHI